MKNFTVEELEFLQKVILKEMSTKAKTSQIRKDLSRINSKLKAEIKQRKELKNEELQS